MAQSEYYTPRKSSSECYTTLQKERNKFQGNYLGWWCTWYEFLPQYWFSAIAFVPSTLKLYSQDHHIPLYYSNISTIYIQYIGRESDDHFYLSPSNVQQCIFIQIRLQIPVGMVEGGFVVAGGIWSVGKAEGVVAWTGDAVIFRAGVWARGVVMPSVG